MDTLNRIDRDGLHQGGVCTSFSPILILVMSRQGNHPSLGVGVTIRVPGGGCDDRVLGPRGG